MGYAAEYLTGEICDGLSIIGLLCIIPFSMGEEVGVQSWRFLTQRRRDAEYAEIFRAACGRGIGVGRFFIKVFNAYPPSAKRESAKRMP